MFINECCYGVCKQRRLILKNLGAHEEVTIYFGGRHLEDNNFNNKRVETAARYENTPPRSESIVKLTSQQTCF